MQEAQCNSGGDALTRIQYQQHHLVLRMLKTVEVTEQVAPNAEQQQILVSVKVVR